MFIYECYAFFFFNDTATTEIYTLSLHDALPIYADDLRGDVQDALLTLTLTLPARRPRSSRAPLLPPPGIARCRAPRASAAACSGADRASSTDGPVWPWGSRSPTRCGRRRACCRCPLHR